MNNFEVGNHVKFASGRGEITKIEERPNGGHLLHVYTSEGQLRKLPSGLPHIKKLDSLVDRLAAGQSDTPRLHAVYYVAMQPERFARLPDPVTAPPGDRAANWMNRPRALGEFLGYPADAIAAYEADACSDAGAWTAPIPDAELARRVGPLIDQLYDEPPLSTAAILDAVLPYTPPQPAFGTFPSTSTGRSGISRPESAPKSTAFGRSDSC